MNQLLPLLIIGAAAYFAYQRGLFNQLLAPPAAGPVTQPTTAGPLTLTIPAGSGGVPVLVPTDGGGAIVVPPPIPAPAAGGVGAPAITAGGLVSTAAPAPIVAPIPVTPLEVAGGAIATGFGESTMPTRTVFADAVAPETRTAAGVEEQPVDVPASATDELLQAFADPRSAAYSAASRWVFNWRQWNYIARTVANRPGHNMPDVPVGYAFGIGDLFTMWAQRGLSGISAGPALGGIVQTGAYPYMWRM